MFPHSSHRLRLRSATSNEHRRLDALVLASDPFASEENYVDFLQRHLDVRRSIGAAFGGLAPTAELVATAQRSIDAIGDDLLALGRAGTRARIRVTPASNEAQGWGIAYVLEGSRLGGRILAGLATEHLGSSVPTSFLWSADDGPAWQSFCKELEQSCASEVSTEAALGVFSMFADAFTPVGSTR